MGCAPPTLQGRASAPAASTFSFLASQHWLNWSDGAAERGAASHRLCPHRPPRMWFLWARTPLAAWGTPHPAATAGWELGTPGLGSDHTLQCSA